jgi:hypothetical protein
LLLFRQREFQQRQPFAALLFGIAEREPARFGECLGNSLGVLSPRLRAETGNPALLKIGDPGEFRGVIQANFIERAT